jgi:hypothetical protein
MLFGAKEFMLPVSGSIKLFKISLSDAIFSARK